MQEIRDGSRNEAREDRSVDWFIETGQKFCAAIVCREGTCVSRTDTGGEM